MCFTGPLIALMAAQQAAKQNHAYNNESFTQLLREHAHEVRTVYPRLTGENGDMLFPEPYENAWSEYAAMLDAIAEQGLAAGPDNAQFFLDPAAGTHYLLMPDFYDAVAGRVWCWFFRDAPGLLEGYREFFPCWWPPLPGLMERDYINSEIFSLHLSRWETRFSTALDTANDHEKN